MVNSSVTHSLLLFLPIACALLLRWARCPGSGLVGGIAAGILLGPTILGRSAPDAFERMFIGGEHERAAYEDLTRAHERERAAALEAAVADAALTRMSVRHGAERDAAHARWRAAQWTHQRPIRSYTTAIIVLTLLGAGLRRVPRPGAPVSLLASGAIGPWSAVVPGGIAFLVVWQWGRSAEVAILAAAAVAVGPWMLSDTDRAVADAAESGGARTVERAGQIASIVTLLVVGATYALSFPDRAAWALALLALPAGWLLPPVTGRTREIDLALQCVLVPVLAACVAIKIEILTHFVLWLTIVFVLISGDGRWLGAFVGAMLAGGRGALRATRLVLGSMACGPTQLAITAVVVHTWAVPEDVGLALLVGAALMEVTAPARRRVAERLTEAEQELDGGA